MKRILRFIPVALILIAAIMLNPADNTDAALSKLQRFQKYIQDNDGPRDNLKFLFVGDSWNVTDYFDGATVDADNGRPYTYDDVAADPTAHLHSVYQEQLMRHINSNHWANTSQGSAQFMVATDTTRAQLDSCIFGYMTAERAALFDPDVVIVGGGGGYNDFFAGDSYTTIKSEAYYTVRKAIEYHPGADWIVYPTPRPVGIYGFTSSTDGTAGGRRQDALVQYLTLDSLNTFLTDSLETMLADSGLGSSRLLVFDTRPYTTATGSDTTGITAGIFYTTSQAEHDSVSLIKYSPLSWYKVEGDSSNRVHLNDYGDRQLADLLARNLFNVTPKTTYTKGSGDTVYVHATLGDNYANQTRCTDKRYPLRTLAAAQNHAHPGDVICVFSTGNIASMATAQSGTPASVSALDYEFRVTKPGVTLYLRNGAYIEGVYDASSVDIPNGNTSVGFNFFQPHQWTIGTGVMDSTSHNTAASWYAAIAALSSNPNFDWTIAGEDRTENYIGGYQRPFEIYAANNLKVQNISFFGGAGEQAIWLKSITGNAKELTMTFDSISVYVDSSSTSSYNGASSAVGQVYFENYEADGSTTEELNSTDGGYFNITWRRCEFIGRSEHGRYYANDEEAVFGPMYGNTFIECSFTDDRPGTYWVRNDAGGGIATGDFRSVKFINCLFASAEDSSGGTWNIYHCNDAMEDSTFFINCLLQFPSLGGTLELGDASSEGTGAETIVIGTNFDIVEIATGDLDPNGGAITDGYSANSFDAKNVTSASDTCMAGGRATFVGYDLDEDFGVTHSTTHVSMGPDQIVPPLLLRNGDSAARYVFHTPEDMFEALIETGIIDTGFEIPISLRRTADQLAYAAWLGTDVHAGHLDSLVVQPLPSE